MVPSAVRRPEVASVGCLHRAHFCILPYALVRYLTSGQYRCVPDIFMRRCCCTPQRGRQRGRALSLVLTVETLRVSTTLGVPQTRPSHARQVLWTSCVAVVVGDVIGTGMPHALTILLQGLHLQPPVPSF